MRNQNNVGYITSLSAKMAIAKAAEKFLGDSEELLDRKVVIDVVDAYDAGTTENSVALFCVNGTPHRLFGTISRELDTNCENYVTVVRTNKGTMKIKAN